MNRRFLTSVFICAPSVASFLCGCRIKPVAPATAPQTPSIVIPDRPASRAATQNAKADSPLPTTLAPPPRLVRVGATPQDPKAPFQFATRFEIYDIVLPAGSISRSEAFWKLIDEDKIDPGTYDTLRRNGIRVGVAPVSDWPSMKELIERVPSTTHLSSATGHDATNLEISLKPDVLSETIFVYMADHTMVGRTFERCENLLTVSFQQVPRKPGQLRVAMAPVVRSTRKQLSFTTLGNEQEYAYSYPEKAIDVNLWADIPADNLLIVAPSEEAKMPSSIGRAFLMQDSPAERQEHVLVMVPRMFRLDEAAPPAQQAALPR